MKCKILSIIMTIVAMFELQTIINNYESQLENRKEVLLLNAELNHNKIMHLNESVARLKKDVNNFGWTETSDSLFHKYEHELTLVEKLNESHSIIFGEMKDDFSQFYGVYIWIYEGLVLTLYVLFVYLMIKL